jgi:hypothetical protein
VPDTIDATGSRNVAAELQSFVSNAPNGSTIVLKAGGTYRLDRRVSISGKRNVTLEGNGATIRSPLAGGFDNGVFFVENYSENVVIRNLTIVGANDKAGTSDAYDLSHEQQTAISVFGSTNTIIEGVTIRRVYGDCLYVSSTLGEIWANGVTFRDSTCELTGRNGVSVIAGNHVLIERVMFDEIGTAVLDIEPDNSREGATDVVLRDSTIGTYGLNDLYDAYVLASVGATGSVVRDVTVTNNRIEGNPSGGYDGRPYGLHVVVYGKDRTRANIRITNNTVMTPVRGPAIRLEYVQGATVTGNIQPLISGELASFPGSSDVTYVR